MVTTDTDIAKGRSKRAFMQKVYYWYLVVSAIESVLTFMATAIKSFSPLFKGVGGFKCVASLKEIGISITLKKNLTP